MDNCQSLQKKSGYPATRKKGSEKGLFIGWETKSPVWSANRPNVIAVR